MCENVSHGNVPTETCWPLYRHAMSQRCLSSFKTCFVPSLATNSGVSVTRLSAQLWVTACVCVCDVCSSVCVLQTGCLHMKVLRWIKIQRCAWTFTQRWLNSELLSCKDTRRFFALLILTIGTIQTVPWKNIIAIKHPFTLAQLQPYKYNLAALWSQSPGDIAQRYMILLLYVWDRRTLHL